MPPPPKRRDSQALDDAPKPAVRAERTVVDASVLPEDPSDYAPPEVTPADEGLEGDAGEPTGDVEAEPAVPGGDGKTLVFDSKAISRPAASGPKGKLVIVGGPKAGGEHVLAAAETTIGRGNDNVWVIPDISVSRKHILIRRSSHGFVLHDQGSGNGTVVNGERLEEDRVLETGDEIEIGDTVIKFEASTAKAIVVQRGGKNPAPAESTGVGPSPRGAMVKRGQGPRTGTAKVAVARAGGLDPRRKKLYIILGTALGLLLVVGMIAKLSKPKPPPPPPGPTKQELGAQALQEGLDAFKALRFDDAAQKFEEAADELDDPEEAKKDLAIAKKEMAAKGNLAAAQLAFSKGALKDTAQSLGKIDTDSALADQAEELRKKLKEAVAAKLKDAQGRQDSGDLDGAKALVTEALAADPTNVAGAQLNSDIDRAIEDRDKNKNLSEAKRRQLEAEKRTLKEWDPVFKAQSAFAQGDLMRALQASNECSDARPPAVGAYCRNLATKVKTFNAAYQEGMNAARGKRTDEAIRSLEKAKDAAGRIVAPPPIRLHMLHAPQPGAGRYLSEINENLSNMYYLAGIAAKNEDEQAKAALDFQKAVAANPNNALAKRQMGEVKDVAQNLYLQAYVDANQDPQKARRECRQVLQITSKSDPWRVKCQKILDRLDRDSADQ